MTRRSVLLPQPFGPTRATMERGAISRSSPPITSVLRPSTVNANRTSSRRIAGTDAPAVAGPGSLAARPGSADTITSGKRGAGGRVPRAPRGVYRGVRPAGVGRGTRRRPRRGRRRARNSPKGPSDRPSIAAPCGARPPCGSSGAPCGSPSVLADGVPVIVADDESAGGSRASLARGTVPLAGNPAHLAMSPAALRRSRDLFLRPLRADQMIAREGRSAQGDLSTRFPLPGSLIHAASTPAIHDAGARRASERRSGCAWRRPSAPRACAGARAGLRDDLAS